MKQTNKTIATTTLWGGGGGAWKLFSTKRCHDKKGIIKAFNSQVIKLQGEKISSPFNGNSAGTPWYSKQCKDKLLFNTAVLGSGISSWIHIALDTSIWGSATVIFIDGFNCYPDDWFLKLRRSWGDNCLFRFNTIISLLEVTGHFHSVEEYFQDDRYRPNPLSYFMGCVPLKRGNYGQIL